VQTIAQVLANGQRLRGCLTCLISEALGGRFEAAVPRVLVIECIQAASLIHDDVVDGDLLRRDRAATWVLVGRRRAVLLGDLIFATALQRMAELSQADGLAAAEAIATMASGAYQEPLAHGSVDAASLADEPDFYPRLIHLKTGVLFGAAARLGALAAEAPPPVVAQAFELGVRIGEAYQMADDLQDLIELELATKEAMAEQLPLLVPLLTHFCADAVPGIARRLEAGAKAGDLGHALVQVRPLLRTRLREAIDARLRQAHALACRIPANGHASLLQAAPAQITGLMLDSSVLPGDTLGGSNDPGFEVQNTLPLRRKTNGYSR
jgi:hypothetical protein